MDHCMSTATAASSSTSTRPFPPPRAVSSGSALYGPGKIGNRPQLPSRLSAARSISQGGSVADLTREGNGKGYLGKQDGGTGGVVGSPEVVELHDHVGEGRPSKRLKLDAAVDAAATGPDSAHTIIPGDLFPSLPRQPNPSIARPHRRRRRQTSSYSATNLAPPSIAPRVPPPRHVADFHPWTGTHPEDVLNDTVVKSGYADKPPAPGNNTELNSAKPAIWANLSAKNNPGLQLLGVLFTQVMEKRQHLGRVTGTNTFRPPPRVTVTDSKREAWLRDLANPDVVLRKMSRTIPHGIRGKALLDQCLSKDIPLQRAVWLAKCVGANELRAFRRKGVSGSVAAAGEQKWLREWTVGVEQFLEGVVADCGTGENDWQVRFQYAIKLATGFYAEGLLENGHYLDWVVASFTEATVEKVPVWMLLLQIHWKDLLKLTRRGRRLAEALLQRMRELEPQTSPGYDPLKQRLRKLVAILAVTRSGCMVLPQTWQEFRHLLAPSTGTPAWRTLVAQLERRNERLAGPLNRTPANTRSPLLQLYDTLDAVGLAIDFEGLTKRCTELMPEVGGLVPALLAWASSPFRCGAARIYLSARIIAALRTQGHDTDAALLNFFAAEQSREQPPERLGNVYRIIVELVRLRAFAVATYLQWMLSIGAYATPGATTGLLAVLPADGLPAHVNALRKTLLGRVAGGQELEEQIREGVRKAEVEMMQSSGMLNAAAVDVQRSPLAVQSFVAAHVRSHIAATTMQSGGVLDLRIFCFAREIFEKAGDVASLAELVKLTAESDHTILLATAIDTIMMHAESFAALGSLLGLTETMLERYRILRPRQVLDRTLILSLASLVRLVNPSDTATLEILSDDLLISEQQNTAAVYSPASDNLIGMQASALESEEDIDAVFASGNTMDDALLQRVFMRVLQRVGKQTTTEIGGGQSKLSGWLNQLRVVGRSSFEQVVDSFISSFVKGGGVAGLDHVAAIMALIGSTCLGVDAVVDATLSSGGADTVYLVLGMLLGGQGAAGLAALEQYHYATLAHRYCQDSIEQGVKLLLTACGSEDFRYDDPATLDLMVAYMSKAKDTIKRLSQEARERGSLPTDVWKIQQNILQRSLPSANGSSKLDINTVVRMADPLSIRFCSALLRQFTRSESGNAEMSEAAMAVVIEMIQKDNSVWPQLLGSAVSEQTKKGLHEWARDRVLFASGSEGVAEKYLDVLDITSAALRGEDDAAVLTMLNDRLREAGRKVEEQHDVGETRQHLDTLLHVCTLHISPPTHETDGNRQARTSLLTTTCSLLVQPGMQLEPPLVEHLYDLTSAFAASVSEESLASLARSLKPTHPRLISILGPSPSPATDTWLSLVSPLQPPCGGTAQQRALARHASNHQQQQQQQQQQPSQRLGTTPLPHQPQRGWPGGAARPLLGAAGVDVKVTPYPLRKWEIMPDPTPVMGENDTSISLGLFGGRKV